jgi:hypothetical protein
MKIIHLQPFDVFHQLKPRSMWQYYNWFFSIFPLPYFFLFFHLISHFFSPIPSFFRTLLSFFCTIPSSSLLFLRFILEGIREYPPRKTPWALSRTLPHPHARSYFLLCTSFLVIPPLPSFILSIPQFNFHNSFEAKNWPLMFWACCYK